MVYEASPASNAKPAGSVEYVNLLKWRPKAVRITISTELGAAGDEYNKKSPWRS